MSEPESNDLEKNLERVQENEERGRKGKTQAAKDPKREEDPRGDREPPQPFSGPSR